jgi:hypothetical protein
MLEADNTEYLIPLLLDYQEAVKNRMHDDQQLLDYYTRVVAGRQPGSPEEISAENERLSHLYAQHHQKELRLFEELTEELYGNPKKRWELHDDMITLPIGEIPAPVCQHYKAYTKAKRVLRLHKCTTLFEKLHTDADDILPLLETYQEAVVDRCNVDQQLLTIHTVPQEMEMEELAKERDRLTKLFAQKQMEEDQCFAKLTKELYGVEKKRQELHHDMENKTYYGM